MSSSRSIEFKLIHINLNLYLQMQIVIEIVKMLEIVKSRKMILENEMNEMNLNQIKTIVIIRFKILNVINVKRRGIYQEIVSRRRKMILISILKLVNLSRIRIKIRIQIKIQIKIGDRISILCSLNM